MSSYRRTSVFINKNNHSIVGSISSFKTGRTPRIRAANIDSEECVESVPTIDPRFMIIEKKPVPPSPKKPAPITIKIENWLQDAEKPRKTNIPIVQHVEKRNFQNLKRHHLTKSASRTSKLRSISISRPCVSNHEVSSTNEELFTPRRRRPTPRERIRKLNKSKPNLNQQTIDIHYEGCTNDSDECCLHRQCSKAQHDCNVINLCCKQKHEMSKPMINVERKCIEIDRIGDGVDQPAQVLEQISFSRSKQTVRSASPCRPVSRKPIYKLVCPIVIFTMISLSMLSVQYEFGILHKIWRIIAIWFDTYSLIGLRKPLTKWELWVIFINKCNEKFLGVLTSPFR